ncbi:MAG: Gldg family protein [Gammaproteobacteria bacterium]
MTTAKTRSFDLWGLLLLVLLFLAVIMLGNVALRGMRWDLTEGQLFTISEGTKRILADIDEPVNLYYFFSDKQTADLPTVRDYARRVEEMLDEFAAYAGSNIKLQKIDPVPFSEQEDLAAKFGLQSVPVGNSGETIYFGVAGTNSVDDAAAIPFMHADKQQFLEYDLAKLVYTLANPKRPVIGVMTSLPMLSDFDPMTQRIRDSWILAEQIEGLFDLRRIATTADRIDDDVDVLMLVHPKNLPDNTLYAIDQFVLAGGKALIFVDPRAEMDRPTNPNDPMAAMQASQSSDLARLFEAWGIEYSPNQIVGDKQLALSITMRPGEPPVRHVGMLGLTRDSLDQDDVVSGGLDQVNVAMIGYFRKSDDAAIELIPLIQSSADAMPIPADRLRFLADPAELLDGFEATGERYVLAARLKGELETAFPDGAPAPAGDTGSGESADAPEHLSSSDGEISMILVADTDVLTDRLWVQVNRFFGQRIANAWASNGDFVVNALDNLTGSNDLIGIRGRATYSRPFLRVQELEREADERWRGTIQELEDQLAQTESKLAELQANRDDDNLAILTDEQSAELERFQQQRIQVRRDLRDVQLTLNQDKERLGVWLKVLNILVLPFLLTIALAFFASRRRTHAG